MFNKIVAAVDGDTGRSGLVTNIAGELARSLGATVLVVHVREVERPAAMIGTARPGALPPALHPETDDEASALVDGAVDTIRALGVNVEGRVHPSTGSTAKELLDIAESFGATLIVVGDRGSRVSDLVLGSVAHRIVHQATCPVLLAR